MEKAFEINILGNQREWKTKQEKLFKSGADEYKDRYTTTKVETSRKQ